MLLNNFLHSQSSSSKCKIVSHRSVYESWIDVFHRTQFLTGLFSCVPQKSEPCFKRLSMILNQSGREEIESCNFRL